MLTPAVQKLLDDHKSLNFDNETQKVKCSLTNHEMPPAEKAIESYLKGKKYKRLSGLDSFSFEDHKMHIIPNNRKQNEFYCPLTLRHLEKTSKAVELHIGGKKYRNALARWKECQKTGEKFIPSLQRKTKLRCERDKIDVSAHDNENGNDKDDEKDDDDDEDDDISDMIAEDIDDEDDDMSDLYPEADFKEESSDGEEETESVTRENIPPKPGKSTKKLQKEQNGETKKPGKSTKKLQKEQNGETKKPGKSTKKQQNEQNGETKKSKKSTKEKTLKTEKKNEPSTPAPVKQLNPQKRGAEQSSKSSVKKKKSKKM